MMENIMDLLRLGGYSCVVVNCGEIRTFRQHGIEDLYDLHFYNARLLKGATIADKIVGLAAATLMLSGGAALVYAGIISSPALKLLRDARVDVSALQVVPMIENRDRTDWCPLEKNCLKGQTAKEIMTLIDRFMMVHETGKLSGELSLCF